MTTNNILRWIIFVGLFAVPFIPFIITQSMLFPFITGKGFAFRILTEIIFACWLLLALREPQYRPKWNLITKSLLIFLGVILVADIFSKYPYKSFWSNYERMEGFVLMAHLVAFYFVFASFIKSSKLWRWFWNVELGAGVAMSIYGFLQLAGKIAVDQGGVRLDATFGNASYLAIYLVFNMFIALMLFFSEDTSKMWKWIYAAVFVLQGIPLYYTATRGSIGGFIGGIALAALIVAFKERQNRAARKIAYWLLGCIVVLIVGFVALRNTPFIQKNEVLSRFSQLSASDLESQGRAYVWPMAVKGVTQSPKTFLIGWGQESFNYVFNQNYNPAMYDQEQWFDRAHDIILDWLINAGLLGLIAYITVFVALLYMLWKKSDFSIENKALVTGLMAAYIFNNIFVFDNIGSYMLFFAILAWVSSRSSVDNQFPASTLQPAKQFSRETLNYMFAPAIAIVLVATVYFVNVPAIQASRDLIQALGTQPSGLEANIAYFKQAFAQNSFGTPEVLEQLAQAAIQVIGSNSADATAKQDFYNLTDQQLKAQVARTPQDARYLLLAGSFYDRAGQYDAAIPYLNDAIKYSPNKPAMYFELATAYLGKSNPDQAFKLFTQGYNLATSSSDNQIIYAIGALYDKQGTIVQQMFAQIGQDKIVSDNRVLQAYVNLGDYSSAASILTVRLQKNPGDYQSELQLASIYAQAGQNSQAVKLIQDVETKNPSLKPQLDPYIQQLQAK